MDIAKKYYSSDQSRPKNRNRKKYPYKKPEKKEIFSIKIIW